jgi:hypothetical protein
MLYFGVRVPSVLNAKLPFTDKTTVSDLIKKLPQGNRIIAHRSLARDIWEEIISMQKVDIVIKSPKTLLNNISSNVIYSAALGQNLFSVIANSVSYFKSTKEYVEISKKISELQVQQSVTPNKKILDEIKALELELTTNPVHPLMEAGLFSTIIEDVRDQDLTSNSKIDTLLSENKSINND